VSSCVSNLTYLTDSLQNFFVGTLKIYIYIYLGVGSVTSRINTGYQDSVQFVFLFRLNEWEFIKIFLMRVLIKVRIVRWVHMQALSGVSLNTDDAPAVVDCQP
jgi:hypothetical protein